MNKLLIENISLITKEGLLPNYSLLVENGKITSLAPHAQLDSVSDAFVVKNAGTYLAPGFIDLHIHGFAGHGPEQGTPEALLAMSQALANQGVTAFCPTLYSLRAQAMLELLTKLAPAIGQEQGAKIIGFHLEGPFISPAKPGVMKPQDIISPDVKLLEQLYEAANGHIAAITLAPELKKITPVIDFCLKHHILPQAGHTNATYEEFLCGVQAGVNHVTHLFNAMSPFHHRAPGVAGGALLHPEVSCEIIADGVHVHPEIVAFLRTAKSPDKIVLVTDSLLPTGLEEGPFVANGEGVIFEAGAWHRTFDHVLAGSALTMEQGVRNLVAWGYSLPQAVQCASTNPAQLMHLPYGRLEEGAPADFVLLDKELNVLHTFINGQEK